MGEEGDEGWRGGWWRGEGEGEGCEGSHWRRGWEGEGEEREDVVGAEEQF